MMDTPLGGAAVTDAQGKFSIRGINSTGNLYITVSRMVNNKLMKVFQSALYANFDPGVGIVVDAAIGGGPAAAPAGGTKGGSGTQAAAGGAGTATPAAGAQGGSGGGAPVAGGSGKAAPATAPTTAQTGTKKPLTTVGSKPSAQVAATPTKKFGAGWLKANSDLITQANAAIHPWTLRGEDPLVDLRSIGGSDNLGKGYNVFDKFADSNSCGARVLDINAMNQDGFISWGPIGQFLSREWSGTTIKTIQHDMSTEIGVDAHYACFSASTKLDFSKSSYQSNCYEFYKLTDASATSFVRVGQNYFDTHGLGVLRHYMTQSAKNALNSSAPPDTVFTTYGTHVLVGMISGARLNVSVDKNTSTYKTSSSFSLATAVKAEMGVAGVSIGVAFKQGDSQEDFDTNCTKVIYSVGGNESMGFYMATANSYNQWIDSVTGREKFCDFLHGDGQISLVPIWMLCDNAKRRDQLEKAYSTFGDEQYANNIGPSVPQKCIVDLKIMTTGDPTSLSDTTDDGWIKLKKNLNEGAGGPYEYIFYKLGMDDTGSPVTRVYTENLKFGGHSEGGTVLDNHSLNEGTPHNGDTILLAFLQEVGKKAVRGLCILDVTKADPQARQTGLQRGDNFYPAAFSSGAGSGQTWYFVNTQGTDHNQDLNAGAGGNTLYLGYTYDYISVDAQ